MSWHFQHLSSDSEAQTQSHILSQLQKLQADRLLKIFLGGGYFSKSETLSDEYNITLCLVTILFSSPSPKKPRHEKGKTATLRKQFQNFLWDCSSRPTWNLEENNSNDVNLLKGALQGRATNLLPPACSAIIVLQRREICGFNTIQTLLYQIWKHLFIKTKIKENVLKNNSQ